MPSLLYNTDPNWIEFLRGKGIRQDVNFWRRDQRNLHPPEGTQFYFKQRGTQTVVGRGVFRSCFNLAATEAWNRFGNRNGYETRESFFERLPEALNVVAVDDATSVGCIVIDQIEWLEEPAVLPQGFFPTGILGAKFYDDKDVEFLSAHFVHDLTAGETLAPLVLVQADATAGGEYDDWDDLVGERYHFPNQYKNRVVPGRRFIYYRGVRRPNNQRGQAEYFGYGRIGRVWADPATASSPARNRSWFCSIEDYVAFPTAVPIANSAKYYETITHARAWQTGVRLIDAAAFDAILAVSGAPAEQQAVANTITEVTDLLRRRHRIAVGGVGGLKSLRRSPRAHAIGRWAEQLIFDRLTNSCENVRWMSNEGELPGYDIAYQANGETHGVEVKGTRGSFFNCVELTINEWKAAEALGDRFWLYLVANCESASPRVQVIRNPYSLLTSGDAEVSPLLFRFELKPPLPVATAIPRQPILKQ